MTQNNDLAYQQSSVRSKGWTNEVLVYTRPDQTTYYLPAYLRMKLKNFENIDIPTQ